MLYCEEEEDFDDDCIAGRVDVCHTDDNLMQDALVFHHIFMKAILQIRKQQPRTRNPSLFDQRLLWVDFEEKFRYRHDIRSHLRMSHTSFHKLLAWIYNDLTVNERMANLRGGAILPELCLYSTIRYLSGGSYLDIKFFTGV
jgi:hypothetical protein